MNRHQRNRIALALCLVLTLQACALRTTRVGAVDSIDSHAFDVLGTAAITIEALKADCPSATCAPAKKTAINNIIGAYDIARTSWLTYREAIKAGRSADGSGLNRLLAGVLSALSDYRKAIQ